MNIDKLHASVALAGLIAAVCCGAAFAQLGSEAQSAPSAMAKSSKAGEGDAGSLTRKDRRFMEKAAQGSLAEVETGKLAASNASSPEVKKFAERMVQDHGQAGDELKQIARAKGVDLPSDTDSRHERVAKSLEKKSGAEFDKAYMRDMVKDHEEDLKEFRAAAKNARDPDVKAFAEKTAQTISGHLDMARQAAASVGVSKGATSAYRDKSAATNMNGARG